MTLRTIHVTLRGRAIKSSHAEFPRELNDATEVRHLGEVGLISVTEATTLKYFDQESAKSDVTAPGPSNFVTQVRDQPLPLPRV